MKLIFLLIFFITTQAYSQCKAYRLNRQGDTLNCVDFKDLQQGKWVVKVDGIRGEPGYDEEGIFKDGKKDGFWRIYTLMGDLYAVERYRWGNKDGVSQYFNITGLVREESWKAVNPANPYDTIEVPDPIDPYKVEMKVVKIDGSTVEKLKNHEVVHFKSWLYVLSKNYCLMELRKQKRNPVTVSASEFMYSEEFEHPDNMFDKEAQLQTLTICLDKLNEDQKESVRLFYIENKCYQDIAELTGNDWNRVRSLIQNGRRNLKICMEKYG